MAKRKLNEQGRPLAGRKLNTRELRQTFLIVCEGKETEPNYFGKFRVPKTVVIGAGKGGLRLVEETIKIRQRKAQEKGPFTQTWCVFDKDDMSCTEFHQALAEAKEAEIQVAYSNEAFELWFLLHFTYHDRYTQRAEYKKLLSEELGSPYEKNQSDMYERLLSRQAEALSNAVRLLATYQPHDPTRDNPCTTVHELVQALSRQAV